MGSSVARSIFKFGLVNDLVDLVFLLDAFAGVPEPKRAVDAVERAVGEGGA